MPKLTPNLPGVSDLGAYLREQRENAQLSVRQLSRAAGISNPYLSQIERGLRRPSAEILSSLAKGLEISAETLYVRAGLLDDSTQAQSVDARAALVLERRLTARQRRILLDLFDSFVAADDPVGFDGPEPDARPHLRSVDTHDPVIDPAPHPAPPAGSTTA
ncbi:helix-turn-helix domain-containing protein [Agilicoccus flavus]|uniref:helix-turn-helix domain-containing protein n=1 Tax=Agilicoccus flavus TaxID=2775968 RepID=UPI001CF63EB2|nr:helix-turn-helix transcriptional regulator [Agilicoccus flavus]